MVLPAILIYLNVAQGTSVIMEEKLALCYHNTFVERLLQQQQQQDK